LKKDLWPALARFFIQGISMTTDRERLVALLDALDASETTLQRDLVRNEGRTGDWGIRGKYGHVYPDGAGYLLYVTIEEKTGKDGIDREPSPRPWKAAKARLSFCQVTQDGDWEGCLYLDRLPVSDEAEAIRATLGIRKRRHLSGEAKEQASVRLSVARALFKSAKRPPSMRSAA
jgi:hypothetical protein